MFYSRTYTFNIYFLDSNYDNKKVDEEQLKQIFNAYDKFYEF